MLCLDEGGPRFRGEKVRPGTGREAGLGHDGASRKGDGANSKIPAKAGIFSHFYILASG